MRWRSFIVAQFGLGDTHIMKYLLSLLGLLAFLPVNAVAENTHIEPWKLGFQASNSPVADIIHEIRDEFFDIVKSMGQQYGTAD